MKTRFSGILKWLALAGFLLAAGFFYSCGGSGPEATGLVHAQGQEEAALQKEETAAAVSREASVEEDTREEIVPGGSVGGETAFGVTETVTAGDGEIATQPAEIYVYVCGEVLYPGVCRMTAGQRIFEAIEMAGGFTEAAADSWLNLAEPVYDGMKIEAPTVSQAQDPAWLAAHEAGSGQGAWNGQAEPSGTSGGGETSANAVSSKVNINTATKEQLMTLSGIGEVKAADIIRYREENGAFGRIEDIMNVPGIKDAAFQKIKESITV